MFRIKDLKTYKSKTPEVLKFWKLNGLCTIMKLVTVIYIAKLFETIYIPGVDHIVAQPLKPCSASLIEPKETFVLAKKRQNILCFGACEERISLRCRQVTSKVSKSWKSHRPTVLQLRWVISTWWDENVTLFVFPACYEIHWNWFCGRKITDRKYKDQKRSILFRKGCFDRKEYVSNTTNKRCSRQVLQLRYSSSYSIKVYT